MSKKVVDFWGIGAQKSGTSWLYHQLRQKSEFWLPPRKELHYFDRSPQYPSPNNLCEESLLKRTMSLHYVIMGLWSIARSLGNGKPDEAQFYRKWFFSNYHDAWYASLFHHTHKIKGEISPSYSILEESDIRKMYELEPDAKLILILRNPVDRAWSHFRFKKGRIKNFSLRNAKTEDILTFMKSEDQVRRSDYQGIINRFTSVFPSDQLLICFYDAIKENPKQLLQEISMFLGGNSDIIVSQELKKVVYKSKEGKLPKEVELELKSIYKKPITDLSNRYGGYFSKWHCELYNESQSKELNLRPTFQI